MQVSMELQMIVIGVLCQVLSKALSQYDKWVMHSWLQSLWEKVDMLGFQVEVSQLSLDLP